MSTFTTSLQLELVYPSDIIESHKKEKRPYIFSKAMKVLKKHYRKEMYRRIDGERL